MQERRARSNVTRWCLFNLTDLSRTSQKVSLAHTLKLPNHVDQRITATGILTKREVGGFGFRRFCSENQSDRRAVFVGDGPFRGRSFKFFFKWSTGPAAPRLRAPSGVFHGGLSSGSVERDDLSRRPAGETARMPIANLPSHVDGANPRSLHRSSLPSVTEYWRRHSRSISAEWITFSD